MKSTDLALAHNISVDEFNEFIERTAVFPIKKAFLGGIIIPDDVDTEILIQEFLYNKERTTRIEKEELRHKRQEVFDTQEELRYQHEEAAKKQKEEQYRLRINKLKEKNIEGCYEYKVVSLLDVGGLFKSNSGRVNTEKMTQILNELGIDGWHLVTAYSNELGKNALSGGAGGVLLGVNSTVDENILIFERFVRF